MSTKIEWTDETWNPVTGCTKVSPGCDNCYAERVTERFSGKGSFAEVKLHPERLGKPLHWRKPRKVFVNSMSDLFHEDVPAAFITEVFAVMSLAPQHTFQVLTKRHGRMRSLLSRDDFEPAVREVAFDLKYGDGNSNPRMDDRNYQTWPLPNVWLGVSVEDQKWADIRIPALADTPAAVRFLSCEPLLGPINLIRWLSVQQAEGLNGEVTLDDQERQDRVKQGGDVAGTADLPGAHRLPSAPLDSVVVPTDMSTDGGLQPVDDLSGGRVDGDPRAAAPLGHASTVDGALPVQHPGDVSQRGGVGGDSDAARQPSASLASRRDASGAKSTPDGPAADTEPLGQLVDRDPFAVRGSDGLRCHVGERHGPHSPTIDWLIVGGESGPGARPMHPGWARTLRDQCTAAGVPFLFKQWGAWTKVEQRDARPGDSWVLPEIGAVSEWRPGTQGATAHRWGPHRDELMRRVGKKAAGRELDGRTWDQYPEPVSTGTYPVTS